MLGKEKEKKQSFQNKNSILRFYRKTKTNTIFSAMKKNSILFVVVGKFKFFRKPSKFRQKKFSKNVGTNEKSSTWFMAWGKISHY